MKNTTKGIVFSGLVGALASLAPTYSFAGSYAEEVSNMRSEIAKMKVEGEYFDQKIKLFEKKKKSKVLEYESSLSVQELLEQEKKKKEKEASNKGTNKSRIRVASQSPYNMPKINKHKKDYQPKKVKVIAPAKPVERRLRSLYQVKPNYILDSIVLLGSRIFGDNKYAKVSMLFKEGRNKYMLTMTVFPKKEYKLGEKRYKVEVISRERVVLKSETGEKIVGYK